MTSLFIKYRNIYLLELQILVSIIFIISFLGSIGVYLFLIDGWMFLSFFVSAFFIIVFILIYDFIAYVFGSNKKSGILLNGKDQYLTIKQQDKNSNIVLSFEGKHLTVIDVIIVKRSLFGFIVFKTSTKQFKIYRIHTGNIDFQKICNFLSNNGLLFEDK